MKYETIPTDTFQEAFETGQQTLGHEVDVPADQGPQTDGTTGLDVLRDGPEDSLGCRSIDLPARMLLTTPQVLGRVLLFENPRTLQLEPTVLAHEPGHPNMLRIARLPEQPFVPTAGIVPGPGLTLGIRFGTGIDVQTQTASFGGHTGSGGFEGGHFSVAMTAVRSTNRADEVKAGGDKVSDAIISGGVPTDLQRNGLTGGLPIPEVRTVDVNSLPPGTRLPLKWHPDLEDRTGAAAAYFPDAPKVLLGAAMHVLGDSGVRSAGGFVNDVVRGSR